MAEAHQCPVEALVSEKAVVQLLVFPFDEMPCRDIVPMIAVPFGATRAARLDAPFEDCCSLGTVNSLISLCIQEIESDPA